MLYDDHFENGAARMHAIDTAFKLVEELRYLFKRDFDTISVDFNNDAHSFKWIRRGRTLILFANIEYMASMPGEVFDDVLIHFKKRFYGDEYDVSDETREWLEAHREDA